ARVRVASGVTSPASRFARLASRPVIIASVTAISIYSYVINEPPRRQGRQEGRREENNAFLRVFLAPLASWRFDSHLSPLTRAARRRGRGHLPHFQGQMQQEAVVRVRQ